MDLRQYFRKIREVEATISVPHIFVTSLETADGGKAGVVTEVTRGIAAKMIAEGRAVVATEDEKQRFLADQENERVAADRADVARRLHVTVVSDGREHPSNLESVVNESRSSRK